MTSIIANIESKSAHMPGHCDIAYTLGGNYVVTGGSDSYLCIHHSLLQDQKDSSYQDGLDQSPMILKEYPGPDMEASPVICLSTAHKDNIAVGYANRNVYLFSAPPDCSPIRQLTQCLLPLSQIEFHPNGNYLAVASGELEIKYIHIQDSTKIHYLRGHQNGIKCIAFDPFGIYLASMDEKRVIKIWNVEEAVEANSGNVYYCIKSIDPLYLSHHTSPLSATDFCRMQWSPDGQILAIPWGNDIKFLNTDTWKELKTLTGGQGKNIALVSWCKKGPFLASASSASILKSSKMDGVNSKVSSNEIVIWNFDSGSVVKSYPGHECPISAMSWSIHPPTSLSFIDHQGIMNRCTRVLDERELENYSSPSYLSAMKETSSADIGSSTVGSRTLDMLDDLFEKDEIESSVSSSANENIQKASLKNMAANKTTRKQVPSLMDDSSEIANKSDEGIYSSDDDDDFERHAEKIQFKKRRGHEINNHIGHTTFRQKPFQSGATPIKYHRQFLAWNLIGSIISRSDGSSMLNIDVEFHEKNSLRRPLHFTDHYGFTMASLSETGAVFATDGYGSSRRSNSDPPSTDLPSILYFIPFDSWAAKSEWTIHLDESERIQAVGLGRKHAIIVTNYSYVRVFSYSGLQTCLFSITGPVVAVTVSGHLAFIVHYQGSTISFCLFDLEEEKMKKPSSPLPLSPSANDLSSLLWIGFVTDSEISSVDAPSSIPNLFPLTFDSAGILRVAIPAWDYCWTPVLETKKHLQLTTKSVTSLVKTRYWPVGATSDSLICAIIKGDDHFPHCLPKPPLSNIVYRIPLLQLNNSPSSVIEEKVLKQILFNGIHKRRPDSFDDRDISGRDLKAKKQIDRMIVELISIAVENERSVRALDLCLGLYLEKSFEYAIQLAQSKRLLNLAERMDLVRKAKFQFKNDDHEQSRINVAHMGSDKIDLNMKDDQLNSLSFQIIEASKDTNMSYSIEELKTQITAQRKPKKPKMVDQYGSMSSAIIQPETVIDQQGLDQTKQTESSSMIATCNPFASSTGLTSFSSDTLSKSLFRGLVDTHSKKKIPENMGALKEFALNDGTKKSTTISSYFCKEDCIKPDTLATMPTIPLGSEQTILDTEDK